MQQHAVEITTNVGMIGLLAGVWANVLPALVSIVTLIWFSLKIYETKTIQDLLKRLRKKK